jgi:hypothetical protein
MEGQRGDDPKRIWGAKALRLHGSWATRVESTAPPQLLLLHDGCASVQDTPCFRGLATPFPFDIDRTSVNKRRPSPRHSRHTSLILRLSTRSPHQDPRTTREGTPRDTRDPVHHRLRFCPSRFPSPPPCCSRCSSSCSICLCARVVERRTETREHVFRPSPELTCPDDGPYSCSAG